jgi:opacity protein-like surface antigen
MRKYLLATAAALVTATIATPAAATNDGAPYIGIEGGLLIPKSQTVRGQVIFTGTGQANLTETTLGNYRYKKGLDVDLIGGYDLGMFRLEGELGYKHAKPRAFNPGTNFVTVINTGAGTTYTTTTDFGLNRSASVYSAMLNGLVDFGGNGSWGGYAGGGLGYAKVKQFGDSHGGLAWQLIAGAYAPIGNNLDIGLKYRYFHAKSNNAAETFAFNAAGTTCGAVACLPGTATFFNNSKFTSHSLLASLVYSFGVTAPAPAPVVAPPPPPPEAPATQTCPDGSVILATSVCPAPPPPPPPAPAPVERGERGL